MDVASEPIGRGVGRNIARGPGESAERQIDAFVEERHKSNASRDPRRYKVGDSDKA